MQDYPVFLYALYAWGALAIVTFPVLLTITAPYGRHTRQGFGPMINNTVGWIIMEFPSLAVFAALFIMGEPAKSPVNWIFFGIWVVHYTQRTFIFPLRQPNKHKQMPLLVAGSAIFFNLINATFNGFYLGTIEPMYTLAWLMDPRFIIGVLFIISGFIINIQSDSILINLRKPGETGYKIPKGGMYRFVSCPNYLGEIMEWTGWAIATWSLPGLTFALWTAANLIPRALDNHRWYHSKFEDYPRERKAVIPYLI